MSSLITRIASELLMPTSYTRRIVKSAPHRYKVYSIPKHGNRGSRVIAQPAREVKRIQYWVLSNILNNGNVHPAATAYEKGASILRNAKAHVGNPFLLKMDFKDFFPSIKAVDFLRYAAATLPDVAEDEDRELLALILFWKPRGQAGLRLSIGAPSSPKVSNLILHEFDAKLAETCQEMNVSYTRYADDLTFSMVEREARPRVEALVMRVLEEIPWPTLRINDDKTFYGSKAHQRRVTGLVLTNDGKVSLGRDRKRLLRAQVHRFYVLNKRDIIREQQLKGLIAFARSVEPEFIEKMEERYGLKL